MKRIQGVHLWRESGSTTPRFTNNSASSVGFVKILGLGEFHYNGPTFDSQRAPLTKLLDQAVFVSAPFQCELLNLSRRYLGKCSDGKQRGDGRFTLGNGLQ